MRDGSYGAEEVALLSKKLNPDDILLVVGAHIGTLVVPLSKICRRVIAIEPNPETYRLLTTNIAISRCDNVEAHQMASSDKKEKLRFLANTSNSGGSKRLPLRHRDYYYDNPETIDVEAGTLDDLIGGQAVDFIVMDIEGSEVFALRGMQEVLRKARGIQVEFLPHHLLDVAGCSLDDFLQPLLPHFAFLTIPSMNKIVPRTEFHSALQSMLSQGRGDNGLIFEKTV